MNIPTAEEFYNLYSDNPIKWMKEHNCSTTKQVTTTLLLEFAKLHCKAALKAASEKGYSLDWRNAKCEIDKKSILTAYPENLIL